jgi:F plasmid transfer operon, TraF, protein
MAKTEYDFAHMKIKNQFQSGVLFLSVFFLFVSARAEEGLHTSIHKHFQSQRALGMGGAFVGIADDYNAIFYNPAGLDRLENSQINLSIEGGLTADQVASFFKDIDTASQTTNATEKSNNIIGVLNKNYGKQFSFRVGAFEGAWVKKGFGVAVIPADVSMDVKVHNQGSPAVNLRSYADTTIAVAYANRIREEALNGKLSWGLTGKAVHRGFANKQANVLDLILDSNVFSDNDYRWGYTADLDLGALYTPNINLESGLAFFKYLRPTIGVVARNILDLGFKESSLKKSKFAYYAPERLYRLIDVGAKFELPPFWIYHWRLATDLQDINHPNFTWRKGLHLGAEFDWMISSWWKGQYRAGVNQGYFTFGASFLFSVLKLDIVTYGEDIGSFDLPKESRMYMLKLNVDI